jgi:hypothetical protein
VSTPSCLTVCSSTMLSAIFTIETRAYRKVNGAESANAVTAVAAQLASASEQSGDSTRQIAATIQQVAKGITQQTTGVIRTPSSVGADEPRCTGLGS